MKINQINFMESVSTAGPKLKDIQRHIRDIYDVKISLTPIRNRIGRLRQKGLLPLASGNTVSTGEILTGTSTFYDEDGKIRRQWVKTDVEKSNQLAAFQRSVNKIIKNVIPARPIIAPRTNNSKDLLVKIPIADAHIGLLTHAPEVGANMDLKIAKEIFHTGMSLVIDSSPAAHTALLLDLGDTLHSDDSSARTKASGHVLDVDGRYDKLFDMALFILVDMIDLALAKYQKIIFRKTRGNHDGDSSVAIGAFLEAYYRNEPRVTIDRTPSLFWHYQFGKTLHFSTHGHTIKQKDLPEIVAYDCQDIWSETKFRYVDTGHIHHQNIIETRTCQMESHNSLTAGDSFNFGHGYRSARRIKSIVYHKDYGEISRNIVDLSRITAEIENKES